MEHINEFEEVSELRVAIVSLTRLLKRSVRTDNETWAALMTLGVIQRYNGEATPKQVALELELRSSNLAVLLKDLEERGLIQRVADLSDKRKVRLSLTSNGLQRVNATRVIRDQWLLDAMQCLSDTERKQLLDAGTLIHRIVKSQQNKS
ncbi:MarR family winged helix-turn-helix transcriptional regulator [Acinetobacter sp. WZC-1]|uniref:MarR family winged helix-turn-helix transcriptional regulator n=1 Tax=Acinetobacter sp. WZC-1 TaxID=3459034 RepID=UPI00403DA468